MENQNADGNNPVEGRTWTVEELEAAIREIEKAKASIEKAEQALEAEKGRALQLHFAVVIELDEQELERHLHNVLCRDESVSSADALLANLNEWAAEFGPPDPPPEEARTAEARAPAYPAGELPRVDPEDAATRLSEKLERYPQDKAWKTSRSTISEAAEQNREVTTATNGTRAAHRAARAASARCLRIHLERLRGLDPREAWTTVEALWPETQYGYRRAHLSMTELNEALTEQWSKARAAASAGSEPGLEPTS